MTPESKNELLHTGTIFGAGVAGSYASNVLGQKLGWSNNIKRMTAIGSGAALLTDYAAVKLNKKIGEHGGQTKSASANKYLVKIAETYKG